ncbi:BrnA antitoxin family protein [Phascolarctobacterium sp.]|uniref:BrnA antitoxin family protein n=1 Tax=Phascolarctobacterium sp. TaxID=2049039 RepID=UPI003866262B
MAITRKVIDLNAPVPQDLLKELELAAQKPAIPDADCPELTDEQLEQLAEMVRKQKSERVKKVVSLRISPATLEKAQRLGKGYTGVLSRILENALNNPELLKQCL